MTQSVGYKYCNKQLNSSVLENQSYPATFHKFETIEIIVWTPKQNDKSVEDIMLIIVQSGYCDPNLCCYFLAYLSA